jgi:hypothetical protein
MELRADVARREWCVRVARRGGRRRWPGPSWRRSPHLSAHSPFTGPDRALIHVKTGHLAAA